MFREMRRKDRALSEEEAKRILTECDYGVLSTLGEDGYPYGVPVNYAYKDGRIYFHGALEGSRLDNIRRDNRVSFCVVGKARVLPDKFSTQYESVVVFGRVRELAGAEKLTALRQLLEQLTPDFLAEGATYIAAMESKTTAYSLEIEHMTGKARKEA